MKCETCIHCLDCMNFFCNKETNYKDYRETPPQDWQIENIRVPFNVIIPA